MYKTSVILLLFVLPIVSVAAAVVTGSHASIPALAAVWLVFWAGGVRLFIAGIRQIAQPGFTAKEIFKLEDDRALPVVREIGFANLALGTLAVASMVEAAWLTPAALASGLYYAFAGLGHVFVSGKNSDERFAMYSDLCISVLLLGTMIWH